LVWKLCVPPARNMPGAGAGRATGSVLLTFLLVGLWHGA